MHSDPIQFTSESGDIGLNINIGVAKGDAYLTKQVAELVSKILESKDVNGIDLSINGLVLTPQNPKDSLAVLDQFQSISLPVPLNLI